MYTRLGDSQHDETLCTITCVAAPYRARTPPPECILCPFLTNRLAPFEAWKHRGGWSWCVGWVEWWRASFICIRQQRSNRARVSCRARG